MELDRRSLDKSKGPKTKWVKCWWVRRIGHQANDVLVGQ